MTVRRVSRGRVADLTVGQLTLSELQHELRRRVGQLQAERDQLLARVGEIEAELKAIDGDADGAGNGHAAAGGRRRDQPPLKIVLRDVLAESPLTTAEAARAALERGYVTRSKNFTSTVSVVLNRESCFEKRDGHWHASGPVPAETGQEAEREVERDAEPAEV